MNVRLQFSLTINGGETTHFPSLVALRIRLAELGVEANPGIAMFMETMRLDLLALLRTPQFQERYQRHSVGSLWCRETTLYLKQTQVMLKGCMQPDEQTGKFLGRAAANLHRLRLHGLP